MFDSLLQRLEWLRLHVTIILGLDVSTSVTGVCIVDDAVKPDDRGSHIRYLDRIEFKGCCSLWEKADKVYDSFLALEEDGHIPVISRVVLEEPLMGFRPGMSSAQTISTLMRFNGIVSYLARERFSCEPEYISSAHARKLCGIKLQLTALGGPQKEQVFSFMAANDLKHVQWPLKKSGNIVDWSRDACDAYVIARAAALNGPVQPPVKKSRKAKQEQSDD
jgi:hypothetical protein